MPEDASSFLPLPNRHYLVLVVLARGTRHGYAIKKEIRQLSGGGGEPGAGSLYQTLRQLDEGGLIAEAPERPDPALDDERRVYYELTELGREVLALETARLQHFLSMTTDVVNGDTLP